MGTAPGRAQRGIDDVVASFSHANNIAHDRQILKIRASNGAEICGGWFCGAPQWLLLVSLLLMLALRRPVVIMLLELLPKLVPLEWVRSRRRRWR